MFYINSLGKLLTSVKHNAIIPLSYKPIYVVKYVKENENMKKTILLVVAVVMIASLILASGPALRVVRLTVINKSGNDVFLKLE